VTVGELSQQCKDLLHIGASHDAADLVIVNRIVLQALNNARVWAERENDFALSLVHGTVVAAPGTGASLDQVLVDGEVVKMKSIVASYYEPVAGSGEMFPIRRRPRATYVGSLRRTNLLAGSYGPYGGYGSRPLPRLATEVHDGLGGGGGTEILTFGNSLFIEPAGTTDITLWLDGYRWMRPYQYDTDTDFFTEHGSDFLLWKAIIEVNHRLEIFAQRQEGTLPPPTTMRDEAWESLLKWDAFLHESGREYTLLT
jgi:hypothetical protein